MELDDFWYKINLAHKLIDFHQVKVTLFFY